MERKKIKFGEKVPIKFTIAERDHILNDTFAGGDMTAPLKIAVEGSKLKIMYSVDILEELIGYIAAAANHCEDAKLQRKLDKLFERLKKIEESYILED